MDGPLDEMKKTLHNLAEIRIGHSFRGRIDNDPAGDVRVLQIKDVKRQDILDASAMPRIAWQGSGDPPLLAAGDIVLAGRGEHHHAAMADGADKIVPTSLFLVLRVRDSAVIPEYLRWYLNQSTARSYFREHRTGSNIPMLSKQALGALPVPVPSLQAQQKIVALHRLAQDERRLTEQLLVNREMMLDGIAQRLLES
jgi:hypothetical protein